MNVAILLSTANFQAREMIEDEVPQLQLFFEENPAYFEAVHGQGPTPQEGQQEFDDFPPADMPFGKRWMLVVTGTDGQWMATVQLLSDFLAPAVWHIGLFIVATPLYGTGIARTIYDAMELWMRNQGARWVRLGAVEGWGKAENFWRKMSCPQVRSRDAVAIGQRVNNGRMMAKPLTGGAISDYLQMVKRGNPGHA
jgi:GNAT superfamily N-acetyltransferase